MRSGRIPSVNNRPQYTFAHSPEAHIPRSVFDRSHGHKTTFDEGYLIPIYLDEALPGDTFSLKMTAFARMATPIFPIMDNMYLESFFFAVPYRLVWDNWQKFNGEQLNTNSSTSYLVPTCTAASGVANGSLHDYMGIPTAVNSITFDNLFPRAYNLIWNEWFRDENLQNSLTVDTGDGPDTLGNYTLKRRNKRYDYFTSCLPWAQKVNDGSTLNVPLGGSASVVSNGADIYVRGGTGTMTQLNTAGTAGNPVNIQSNTTNGILNFGADGVTTTGLKVDLSTATGVTINELREAFQIQKLFERDARGGTRYTEIIRSHFGVISPDARLQRPELLGMGSTPVSIHPVAQTSGTGASGTSTAQGNLAAFATASIHNHGFTKSFTEHTLILGLIMVRADLNYQQGLNRMWSRQTRYDFYWPSLAHIGEQSVLNKEIYLQGTSADNNVFGYQERFAEYRYKPSLITGQFRSNFAQTLDAWHLAQEFGSLPSLNSTFIEENAPMTRILASATAPHFLFDSFIKLTCARPMPTYSVPGLIDHF